MTTPVEIRDARYRALADATRRRILRVLEDTGEAVDIPRLAELLALHPNTVRGHLDMLDQAGLVTKVREKRAQPGRPRWLYARAGDVSDPSPAGNRLLAEMLVTSLKLAGGDAQVAARAAGREWGESLGAGLADGHESIEDDTVAITRLLDDIGFEPEPSSGPGVIDLADCPFRELAVRHSDVVCSLHLGMMEGALEAFGGSLSVESLQPFVEPSLCRVGLRAS